MSRRNLNLLSIVPTTELEGNPGSRMSILLFRALWLLFLLLAIWAGSSALADFQEYVFYFAAVSSGCFFCAEIDAGTKMRRRRKRR